MIPAQIRYALADRALHLTLSVQNWAAFRLPYGLGFHPWFPRFPGTLLQAVASTVCLKDERHLPAGSIPVTSQPRWDFRKAAPLPNSWINNAFEGWNGCASIIQPEQGLALSLQATSDLGLYILYSPSLEAEFFCLEPVRTRSTRITEEV